MDSVELMSVVPSLVGPLVAYLQQEAARKAGEKAAEVVGEKTGTALTEIGPKTLALLRSWFEKKSDVKAQKVLELVEHDPEDTDYHQQLVKETARVASDTPAFAQELHSLAQQVVIAQPESTLATFHNHAPNEGVQAGRIDSLTFHKNKPS